MKEYINLAVERLLQIERTQRMYIEETGRILATMIEEDRLIYVFGAGGHTSLVVGEMFFRVGGLANVYPISECCLSAFSRASKFMELERCEGLGSALIRASGIKHGDALLVFHTIGVNATCIEAAREGKKLGATVVGVASTKWQESTPHEAEIRASGKENLKDVVDMYIDDCNTVEDAVVRIPGMDVPAGALSGIGSFAIAHMIELSAMEECLRRGIKPPIWDNANTPQGVAGNAALMRRYKSRIPML